MTIANKELGGTGVRIPEIGVGTWRYKGGPGLLRKAVELQPQVADLHTNLGTALVVLDRMQEAVECYATAVSLKRLPSFKIQPPNKSS